MDFALTPAQEEMVRGLRGVAAPYGEHYWQHLAKHGKFPAAYLRALGDEGWTGLAVPSSDGGLGRGLLDLCLAIEELGAAGAGMGAYAFLTNAIGALLLSMHAKAELRHRYLPGILRGKHLVSMAMIEAETGSDALGITTHAVTRGGKFILTGAKALVNNSDRAGVLMIVARTTPADREKRTRGLTVFVASGRDLGLAHHPQRKLGLHYFVTNDMVIRNLEVEPSAIVGERDRGWEVLKDAANIDRAAVAALALGTTRLVLQVAIERAQTRRVFGRPIGMNQAIQHPLTDIYTELEALRLLIYKAAWLHDQRRAFAAEATAAHYRAANLAFRASDMALQTFGGHGYVGDHPIARHWRDVRALRLTPITQELSLSYLGEHVLGLPRSY